MTDLGVRDVGVIASQPVSDGIRAALGDGHRWKAHVTYIDQEAPCGLLDALLSAEDFLDGSPAIVHRGDMLLGSLRAVVDGFWRDRLDVMLVVAPERSAGDPVRLDLRRLQRLIGGSREQLTRGALAGAQVFGPEFLPLAREQSALRHPQAHLGDALRRLAKAGGRIGVHTPSDWWVYDGTLENLLDGNRLLLEKITPHSGAFPAAARIQGRAVIHPTAKVEASTIRGPVVVGAGARIQEAYIGPYTSIGDRVEIHGAEIENSIVLSGARIEYVGRRIEASIVGANAHISRDFSLPK